MKINKKLSCQACAGKSPSSSWSFSVWKKKAITRIIPMLPVTRGGGGWLCGGVEGW